MANPKEADLTKVKQTHDRISQNRPELISDLGREIVAYTEGRLELDSTSDGHKILTGWKLCQDFEAECRDCLPKQVFGIVLRDTMAELGWESNREERGNRTVTVYYSPDA